MLAAQVVVAPGTKVLLATFTNSNINIDEVVLRTLTLLAVSSDQNAATEELQSVLIL